MADAIARGADRARQPCRAWSSAASRPHVTAATSALAHFCRRSTPRSSRSRAATAMCDPLALALGQKGALTATCESSLRAPAGRAGQARLFAAQPLASAMKESTDRPDPDALLRRISARRGARAARQAQDLLRLRARRRQDVPHAAGRARPGDRAALDVRGRTGRDPSPLGDRRDAARSRHPAAAQGRVPRARCSKSSTSTPRSRASPSCSWWTSSRTPTRRARATPSAGRTCSSCWMPASTSSPPSTCSTSRA